MYKEGGEYSKETIITRRCTSVRLVSTKSEEQHMRGAILMLLPERTDNIDLYYKNLALI